MIRFKYGPWDSKYRKLLALLRGMGLIALSAEGRTVNIQISEKGKQAADHLKNEIQFQPYVRRSLLINKYFNWTPKVLVDAVYEVFPELSNMRYGEEIEL